ncbi:GNAT family N-acetyltransferase [Streptomyces microflavus]|uniref:GNAT family N-acetyltransferase n=1 Tax=Streptomyces microflavus TaxID=1919 RepID=UPI0038019DFC
MNGLQTGSPAAVDESHLWLREGRCGIGPYRSDLLETYLRWESDPASMIGFGHQVPLSLDRRRQWLEVQLSNESMARFTVYDLSRDVPEPVGFTVLTRDNSAPSAEYALMIAPEARRRGFAVRATLLTVDYGFHISCLRTIWLQTLAPNTRALRAYRRCGFQEQGRLRETGRWLGEPCDTVLMDMQPNDLPRTSVVRPLLPS